MKPFEFNRLTVLFASFLTLFAFGTAIAQWQKDQRLTFNDSTSQTTQFNNAWCVAAVGDSVHVVWMDTRDGNDEIYYNRSTNNGADGSWGFENRLTQNPYLSHSPSVAASGSNVFVVWSDGRPPRVYGEQIYYKVSRNNGASWSADSRVSSDTSSGKVNPSVSISGSNVQVVWADGRGPNEIYYRGSPDYGTTWGSEVRLSNGAVSTSWPSVATSGSKVYVVWSDLRSGSWEVYYNRSPNNGLSWDGEIRLPDVPKTQENSAVSASGSTVHVVWTDSRDGVYEIYYKRSTDYGVSWGSDKRLTYNSGVSLYPSISTNGSTVEVVWQTNNDGAILSKRSTDGGVTWGPDTHLTTGNSQSVSVSGTTTHVVWYDSRYGNPEISYKRRLGTGFDGFLTEPSQGRHLVRDPARNVLHLVMKSENRDSVYYLRSTDSGTSWSAPLLLGYGKYPAVGLAALPLGAPIQAYALCVAFKGNQSTSGYNMIRYKWNDNYTDPGGGDTSHWHNDSLITSLTEIGPLSLITPGTPVEPRVFVAYPTVPQANPNLINCDNFYYSTPQSYVRETIDTGSPYSLDQPCLAVDGNGAVYAAWKRGDQIRYARRNGGTWNDTLRVDNTTDPSQQPFVECYGDSVFVVWSDGHPAPSDIWRVRKALQDSTWRDWTNISYSSNLVSESPTQACREFTTWSDSSSGAQSDVWYYSPQWGRGDSCANTSTWSYWTHSQMTYTMAGGAYLWSAWTESPIRNQPPYTVLTKRSYFAPPPPPGGGDSFSGYYSVQAGQEMPSPYCLKRDGVMRFADKAVDFARDSLVYELPYLDPQYDYYLRVSSYREAGSNWAQALSVSGSLIRSVQLKSNQVDTAWIKIPPKTYQRDRKVVFVLKKVSGDYVTSLGLMLYQRDPRRGQGGGQSGDPVGLPLREVFAVYPNPTKGEAQVEYSLRTPSRVDLSIYDVAGRLVRKIVDGPQTAGIHKTTWDTKDALGRRVSNGIYFVRLSSPERVKTVKAVIVR